MRDERREEREREKIGRQTVACEEKKSTWNETLTKKSRFSDRDI